MRSSALVLGLVLIVVLLTHPVVGDVYSTHMELYDDGSIRLVVEGSYKLNKTVSGYGEIRVTVEIKEDGFRADVDSYIEANKTQGTSIPQGSLTMEATGKAECDGNKSTGDIDMNFLLESNEAFINASVSMEYTAYKSNHTIDFNLEVVAKGEGTEFEKFKQSVANLSTTQIQMALLFLGINWINIKSLDKSIDDTVTITSSFTVDLEECCEYLINQIKKSGGEVNITASDLIKSYEKSFYQYTVDYDCKLVFNDNTITMNMTIDSTLDINKATEWMGEALGTVSGLSVSKPSIPAPMLTTTPIPGYKPSIESQDYRVLMNTTTEFINEFEILPSTCEAVFRAKGDTVEYKITTPKIRAKGTDNPGETWEKLVGIVNKLVGSLKTSGIKKELESLQSSEVTLEPKGNVKVSETKAKFSEASNVTVEKESAGVSYEDLVMIAIIAVVVIAVVVAVKMFMKK